ARRPGRAPASGLPLRPVDRGGGPRRDELVPARPDADGGRALGPRGALREGDAPSRPARQGRRPRLGRRPPGRDRERRGPAPLGRVHSTLAPAAGSAGPPSEAPAPRGAVPRKEPATKCGGAAGPGPEGEPEKSAHSALQMLAVAPPRLRFAP